MAALRSNEIYAAFKSAYGRPPTAAERKTWLGKESTILRDNLLKDPSAGGAYADQRAASAPSESDQLGALVTALTPKPVDEATLTGRFSSLFDPTYTQNEADINKELDTSSARFTQDQSTAQQRNAQARALALAKTQEQAAAGGASGQLVDQQTAQQLQPYDQAAQDAVTTSSRFTTDTAEQRRKRLLANQQSKATARASYLADPNNVYEFSY